MDAFRQCIPKSRYRYGSGVSIHVDDAPAFTYLYGQFGLQKHGSAVCGGSDAYSLVYRAGAFLAFEPTRGRRKSMASRRADAVFAQIGPKNLVLF